MSDETYAEIDVSEVPFCCPRCLTRATWHEAGTTVGLGYPLPAHFHCEECNAAFTLRLMGALLTPAMMSLHQN